MCIMLITLYHGEVNCNVSEVQNLEASPRHNIRCSMTFSSISFSIAGTSDFRKSIASKCLTTGRVKY